MKKNILIIMTGIMIFLSSCTKDPLTVNEKNPNSPSIVDAKLVLPAAINAVAYTLSYPHNRFDFVYLWHGLWSISGSYSQPQSLTQYKVIAGTFQTPFIEFYSAAGNLDIIEQQSTDPKSAYFKALAKIMKAYIFQNLVDLYGDVPYSEAFKTGAGNLKPKYDKQQAIYEDLVVQLDAAMDLIKTAPSTATQLSPTSDIIYGGNMSLWLKFANTLKLRILVHQAYMDGRATYIKDKIATTAAIGYIGPGEGALSNPPYVVSAGKMNPFYATFYDNAGTTVSDGITYYMAGKAAVDFMVAVSDPRLGKFFLPYSGNNFAGNTLGVEPLTPPASISKLGYIKGDDGTMIGTPTKASPILTDFESLLIQAEAAQRGFIAGNAKAFYESAITQSFKYMGLSVAQAGTYLSQVSSRANFDNAGDKLELILSQKWISLNGIAPVEIWTDYRRSGFPKGLQFSKDDARTAGKDSPPVRLPYPQDEINVNGENLTAVGPIDQWTSKIFWQTR